MNFTKNKLKTPPLGGSFQCAVFSRVSFRGCLEAADKKLEAVLNQNCSPLNLRLIFFFDRFNAHQFFEFFHSQELNRPRGGVINADGQMVMTPTFFFNEVLCHPHCHFIFKMTLDVIVIVINPLAIAIFKGHFRGFLPRNLAKVVTYDSK